MTIGVDNRNIEQSMKDYLPSYYNEILEAMEIIKTEAEEFRTHEEEMRNVLKQFYIDTADEWGIELWEKTCGIKTDLTKSLSDRRATVKTKIRGIGTMTIQRLKNVADGFHASRVEEFTNEYRILITIIGTRGTPADLDAMASAINEIVPAHLATEFVLTYLTWEELTTKNDGTPRTWNEVITKLDGTRRTWDELETTFFN